MFYLFFNQSRASCGCSNFNSLSDYQDLFRELILSRIICFYSMQTNIVKSFNKQVLLFELTVLLHTNISFGFHPNFQTTF